MRRVKAFRPVGLLFCLALLNGGCSDSRDTADAVAAAAEADPVIAVVGGSEIRRSQLQVLVDRLDSAAQLAGNLEARMVDSLIRARALALLAERDMDASDRLALDARVQAFRDELLAQHYLRTQVVAQPVTADQVKQYYQDNLADYTQPGRVRFEYLELDVEALTQAQQKSALAELAGVASATDWSVIANRMQANGLQVLYKSARLPVELAREPLRPHLTSLVPGEASNLIYADRVYVVRVVEREPDRVQPLHEVSADIRKMLAPMQLKQALSEAAEQAMQEFKVQRLGQHLDT